MSTVVLCATGPLDDACQSNTGTFDNTGGLVYLKGQSDADATQWSGGFRFPDAPFATGIVATAVTLKLYVTATSGKSATVKQLKHFIYFHQIANAPEFINSSTTYNVLNRSRTTAYYIRWITEFAAGDSVIDTSTLDSTAKYNFKEAFQLICNGGIGWQTGNAMVVLVIADGTSDAIEATHVSVRSVRSAAFYAPAELIVDSNYATNRQAGMFRGASFSTGTFQGEVQATVTLGGRGISASLGRAGWAGTAPINGPGKAAGQGRATIGSPYTNAMLVADAEWILSCANPNTGSIANRPITEANNTIDPYHSCFAVIGLAEAYMITGDVRYINAAWAYLTWHQSKQNTSTGIIHRYTVSNVAPYVESNMNTYDSTDSYAAMFNVALYAVWTADPDLTKLKNLNNGVSRSLTAINQTWNSSGPSANLTFATPTYPVAYFMDNVEVYLGLVTGERLAFMQGQEVLATQYRSKRDLNLAALENYWNAVDGTYGWAKYDSSVVSRSLWGAEQIPSTPTTGTGANHGNRRAYFLLYPENSAQAWGVIFMNGRMPTSRATDLASKFWTSPNAMAAGLTAYRNSTGVGVRGGAGSSPDTSTASWWLYREDAGWPAMGSMYPVWWKNSDGSWWILPGMMYDSAKARQVAVEGRANAAAVSFAWPYHCGIAGQFISVGRHSQNGSTLGYQITTGGGRGAALGRATVTVGGGGPITEPLGGVGKAAGLGRSAPTVPTKIVSGRGLAAGRGRMVLTGATGVIWRTAVAKVRTTTGWATRTVRVTQGGVNRTPVVRVKQTGSGALSFTGRGHVVGIGRQLPTVVTPSLWLSSVEAAALPTSGTAYNNVVTYAGQALTPMDVLSNQDSKVDSRVLARALLYRRNGTSSYRTQVRDAISSLMSTYTLADPASSWYTLAACRTLYAWPIAADLIDLKTFDPTVDGQFRTWLAGARDKHTSGGASDPDGSIVDIQEQRPNNFGTHASASRIAIDLYLGDTTDLARAVTVFQGWLGDRAQYSDASTPGFNYGADMTWHPNQSLPVPINPVGATLSGRNVDGVLPDDQRRSGAFSSTPWPPPRGSYPWEALQGAVVAAELLHRAGYTPYQWSNEALRRAVEWLVTENDNPANNTYPEALTSDDGWTCYIINKRYGTSYPGIVGGTPGKSMGFADWTHA